MSKPNLHDTQLLAKGLIISKHHYGIFAQHWWTFRQKNIVPIRLGMYVGVELNTQLFTLRVVENIPNKLLPGYSCEAAGVSSVQSTPSAAINEVYKYIFQTSTEYNGQAIMGFDNEQIVEELLEDVEFCPFTIDIQGISLFVSGLNTNLFEMGYVTTFISKYHGQRCLFVQKINKKLFYVEIYKDTKILTYYEGNSPEEVWKSIGILKKYGGTALFGLDHPQMLNAIQKFNHVESCDHNDWNNDTIMGKLFEKYLKRRIAITGVEWRKIFTEWSIQKSGIVEFFSILRTIYPGNYIFTEQEIQAWRRLFKAAGCTEITPNVNKNQVRKKKTISVFTI